MEQEIWKDIPWYEWLYEVSNLWNLISNYDNFWRKNIRKINASLWQNWYLKITLYKNKISKTLLLHRLIAIAFIPNPNNYPVVMHLDNNKLNLNLNNLKWWTHKENNYQIIKEWRNNFTNWKHPDLWKLRWNNKWAKKVNQYTKEWVFIKTFNCIMDWADSVKIKYNNISRACKTWRNAGWFKWSYTI